jgi:hypothetical protein
MTAMVESVGLTKTYGTNTGPSVLYSNAGDIRRISADSSGPRT